jgi:hypothetical protein
MNKKQLEEIIEGKEAYISTFLTQSLAYYKEYKLVVSHEESIIVESLVDEIEKNLSLELKRKLLERAAKMFVKIRIEDINRLFKNNEIEKVFEVGALESKIKNIFIQGISNGNSDVYVERLRRELMYKLSEIRHKNKAKILTENLLERLSQNEIKLFFTAVVTEDVINNLFSLKIEANRQTRIPLTIANKLLSLYKIDSKKNVIIEEIDYHLSINREWFEKFIGQTALKITKDIPKKDLHEENCNCDSCKKHSKIVDKTKYLVKIKNLLESDKLSITRASHKGQKYIVMHEIDLIDDVDSPESLLFYIFKVGKEGALELCTNEKELLDKLASSILAGMNKNYKTKVLLKKINKDIQTGYDPLPSLK